MAGLGFEDVDTPGGPAGYCSLSPSLKLHGACFCRQLAFLQLHFLYKASREYSILDCLDIIKRAKMVPFYQSNGEHMS